MTRAGVVRLALLALLWGSSFLWIKIALRGFSPVQLVLIRLALGAAVLLLIAWQRRLTFPRAAATWGHLFVAALVANAIPYVLFGVGEQTVGSNIAGILNATTPLWTIVIAYLAGTDRKITWQRAAGIGIGFLGTILIFSPWRSVEQIASVGGLACLAASASYGISYVYIGRFLVGKKLSPIVLSASQLTAATILLAAAVPIAGMQRIEWRTDALISVIILGGLGTGAAYVLNYRLITDDGPTLASTVTYLLPVVAVTLGFATLREPITISMGAGVALILAGIFLTRRK